MEKVPGSIVVKEKKEDINKLKEKLAKKEKIFGVLNDVGTAITTFATPTLVGSLLSPFDFDGPVVEIISGVVLLVGIGLKSISKAQLNKIKAMKANGDGSYQEMKFEIDDKDKNNLIEAIAKIAAKKSETQKLK